MLNGSDRDVVDRGTVANKESLRRSGQRADQEGWHNLPQLCLYRVSVNAGSFKLPPRNNRYWRETVQVEHLVTWGGVAIFNATFPFLARAGSSDG